MKKTTLFFIFILSFAYTGFSQFFSNEKKEYTYGKMGNSKKELTGYFWFDNKHISSNGQTVYYLESMDTKYAKIFQSRKYDYFLCDSFYLETFPAISYPGGDLIIMIPRIVDGEIQLFGLNFTKTSFYFVKSTKDYFFIKKGDQKIKITKKYFKELMKDLLGQDEALLARINNDELKYDDLPEIILSYNLHNK